MKRIFLPLVILLLTLYSGFAEYKEWTTYFGGDEFDIVNDLVYADGFIYLLGSSESKNNIAFGGLGPQTGYGSKDIFIAKIDSNGKRLWSFYFGGSKYEYGNSITYDNNYKRIIVTGYTSSTSGITTPSSDQQYYGGGYNDGFIACFDLNGRLIWSTYLGGSSDDACYDLVITNKSTFVVAGKTYSNNLHTTYDVIQPYRAWGYDGFIAEYSLFDGKLIWISYFGGNGNDYITSLAVKGDKVYFGGKTESSFGIAYNTDFEKEYLGNTDGFFGLLKSSEEIDFCTYIGGYKSDEVTSMTFRGDRLVISGITESDNLKVSYNAFQKNFGGKTDVFFGMFNKDELDYLSYFGGENYENNSRILCDSNQFYLTGSTLSTTGIASENASQKVKKDSADIFLAIFDREFKRKFSTYFGGNNHDSPSSIAIINNLPVIAGYTQSVDIPVNNAFQTTKYGNYDGFITKGNFNSIDIIEINKNTFCQGDVIKVKFNSNGNFYEINKFILQISDSNGSFTNFRVLGQAEVNSEAVIEGVIPYDIGLGNKFKLRIYCPDKNIFSANYGNLEINTVIIPEITGKDNICLNSEIYYQTKDNNLKNTIWEVSKGEILSQSDYQILVRWNNPGKGKVIASVRSGDCLGSDTIFVNIEEYPLVTLSDTEPVCINREPFELTNGKPAGGRYFVNGNQITKLKPMELGIGTHEIKYFYETSAGCSDFAVNTITINPQPEKPEITKVSNTIVSSIDTGNQWFLNNVRIPTQSSKVFIPQVTGNYKAKILNQFGCESEFSNEIYFVVDNSPKLKIKTKPVFDILICNEETESYLELENLSDDEIIIDSIKISGANKSDFTYQSDFNKFIPAHQVSKVLFKFKPNNPGEKFAEIIIYSKGFQFSSEAFEISGKQFISNLSISDNRIDFDTVELNNIYFENITLTNNGNVVHFINTPLTSGKFSISGSTKNKIEPGESAILTITFSSAVAGKFDDILSFADTCYNNYQINVSAIIKDNKPKEKVIIESGHYQAKSGDEISIFIKVFNRKAILDDGKNVINTSISFNPTLLHSIGNTPAGFIENGLRKIPLILDISKDSVFSFNFKAALGNDSSTVIEIVDSKVTDSNIEFVINPGVFKLSDLCYSGGTRLIKFDGTISMTVNPNPAFNLCEFNFTLIESGYTKITIFDYLGMPVKYIIDSVTEKGSFSKMVNLSDLSSGNYYILLQTPTYTNTYNLNIIR